MLYLSGIETYAQEDTSTAENFEEFFTGEGEEESKVTDMPKETPQAEYSPENHSHNDATTDHDAVAYSKAKIIALNKITAKSKTIILNLKEPEYFGNIEITLHKCIKKTDPYAPDNIALLQIIENKLDEDPLLLFQGWMFGSSVALSTFEHPIYEIFIKDCL